MATKKRSETASATAAAGVAPASAAINKELLHSMILQRRFEEKVAEAYALGKIGGFCHLYIGQEAVGTGCISMLRPDDYVITTYRDHGQAIARGITPRAVMAELFGRVDGCSKGKGGSMHMFDRNVNFLGGHGIVGGHVPIATGVAFAIKYRGGDQCIVCFMGEAAVNNGAFHESLNMAGLWKLPVIYVIENNKYGMGTSETRSSSIKEMYKRGDTYSIANAEVDGQDVHAVRQAMAEAIERARTNYESTLLEIKTYRFMGHSMSDAVSGTYRTKAELEEYMKRDPINLLKQKMKAAGEMTDADIAKIEQEIAAVVQDAWDFADASPEPPPEALFEDVLVETVSM